MKIALESEGSYVILDQFLEGFWNELCVFQVDWKHTLIFLYCLKPLLWMCCNSKFPS